MESFGGREVILSFKLAQATPTNTGRDLPLRIFLAFFPEYRCIYS